jgi:hypothetical protein
LRTSARDSHLALEVQRQTFLVRQRRYQLHSAPIPAGLPNTCLCSVSAAWASRPALADYRCVSFSLLARFLSCKQRPSCAIEGTLPNGISWLAPPVNHCSVHGTWNHANDRCPNHTPLSQRPTSVTCRSVSGCRTSWANTSSFLLCPDHRPGTSLMRHSVSRKAEKQSRKSCSMHC